MLKLEEEVFVPVLVVVLLILLYFSALFAPMLSVALNRGNVTGRKMAVAYLLKLVRFYRTENRKYVPIPHEMLTQIGVDGLPGLASYLNRKGRHEGFRVRVVEDQSRDEPTYVLFITPLEIEQASSVQAP